MLHHSFCLSSCSLFEPGERAIRVEVSADRHTYRLSDTTAIKLTINNVSSSPVYFSTCELRPLEEMGGSRMLHAVKVGTWYKCACVVEVEPGEQRELSCPRFLYQHLC